MSEKLPQIDTILGPRKSLKNIKLLYENKNPSSSMSKYKKSRNQSVTKTQTEHNFSTNQGPL